jgi:hypothetical protein
MPADLIAKWVGKWPGRSIATWMIVFGPVRRVYRQRLAPYFLPPPGTLPPEPKRQEKLQQRKPDHLRVLGQALFFGLTVWVGLGILVDTWRAVSPRRTGAPARGTVGAFDKGHIRRRRVTPSREPIRLENIDGCSATIGFCRHCRGNRLAGNLPLSKQNPT